MQKYNLVSAPTPQQLKARDLIPEGIGFAQRKEPSKKCIGAFLPG
jgi:hypothetical protein